jgi:hypothetical protein
MPCILVALALFVPRVVMVFIWLLTNWFSQAFETVLWPLLGFFLMPYTTLAYMAAMLNNNHQLSGGWLLLVVVAVLVDLSSSGSAARRRRWQGP